MHTREPPTPHPEPCPTCQFTHADYQCTRRLVHILDHIGRLLARRPELAARAQLPALDGRSCPPPPPQASARRPHCRRPHSRRPPTSHVKPCVLPPVPPPAASLASAACWLRAAHCATYSASRSRCAAALSWLRASFTFLTMQKNSRWSGCRGYTTPSVDDCSLFWAHGTAPAPAPRVFHIARMRTSLLHRGAGSAERQGQGVQRAARHSTTTAVHRHPRGALGTSVAQDQAMSRPPHRAARWRASATAEHTNHVCTAWLGACCVHACASAR